jgi:hypothetical protein
MQLLRNNCHIRANVFAILVAASGRALQQRVERARPARLAQYQSQ